MMASSSVLSGEPAVNAGISSGVSRRYEMMSSAEPTPPRLSSFFSVSSAKLSDSACTSSGNGWLVATRMTSLDKSSAEKT